MKKFILHALAVFLGLALGLFWKGRKEAATDAKLTVSTPVEISVAGEVPAPPEIAASLVAPSAVEMMRAAVQRDLLDGWQNALGMEARLGDNEFEAALKQILEVPVPQGRRRLIAALFTEWAGRDLQGALKAAMTLASPQLKQLAVGQVVIKWTEADDSTAWQWAVALEHEPVLQEHVIESLLANCKTGKAAGYAAWAEALEDPLLRAKALGSAVKAWSKQDMAAMLAWLGSVEPLSLRSELMAGTGWGGKDDPAEALTVMLGWPDPEVRIERVALLLAGTGQNDPQAAIEWLVAQGVNPELQKTANELGKTLGALKTDVATLKSAAARLPAGSQRDSFLGGAAVGLAAEGLVDEALQLLPGIPPCSERSHAVWAAGHQMAVKNPQRGEAWIRGLPVGVDRDTAIQGFGYEVFEKQPQTGLEWIAQISEPEERLRALRDLFGNWRGEDAGRANAWLWATPRLTAKEKLQFSKMDP